MLKKLWLAILLTVVSFAAHAEWVGGVGYTRLSDDSDEDVDLGAISGTIGYVFRQSDNFVVIPELLLGFGISDDSVDVFGTRVKVELDRLYGIGVRGQYSFANNVYLFGEPSYVNAKLTAKASGFSVSDDEWEFGIGAGAGFQFNPRVAAELSYHTYDGTDVITGGLRFTF